MVRKWLFVVYIIVLILGVCTVVCNTANATIYYLSAGTTGGNEDGSSLANAWKTVSDITGLAAGDTVYCAGTGYEYLTVADSVAYVVIPDSTWVIDGGDSLTYGIYSSGKSGVVIDGATIKKLRKTDHGYGVYISGGANNTVKNCDISEVYYATNPDPGTTTWEKQRGYGIYIIQSNAPVISGNTIKDIGATAIIIMTYGGVNITSAEISNNEITNFNVGIRLALADSSVDITGAKIHDNYIHDFNNYYVCDAWHRDMIHIYGRYAVTSASVENVEIYNNYFEDIVNPTVGGTATLYIEYCCKNFKIHHNIFNRGAGNNAIDIKGVTGGIVGGHEIYNNTFYLLKSGLYWVLSSGNKFKNNIYCAASYYPVYYVGDVYSQTNLEMNNNLFRQINGSNIDMGKIVNTYYTWLEWTTAGYDSGSVSADPLFVGGSGSTAFQLQVDSPAIDAGMDLGFTADADGDTIPQGTAPDIGAFEYNTDQTPPSDLTNTVNLPKHSVHTFVDNSSDEEGFQVTINGTVTDSLAANTETFSIDNQTPGTTYNVQIRAYKGDYLSGATVVNFTAPRYRLGRVR